MPVGSLTRTFCIQSGSSTLRYEAHRSVVAIMLVILCFIWFITIILVQIIPTNKAVLYLESGAYVITHTHLNPVSMRYMRFCWQLNTSSMSNLHKCTSSTCFCVGKSTPPAHHQHKRMLLIF